MSVIVMSGEQISRSPINTSQSKQMYSFSKAARFPPLKSNSCASTFYDLPSMTMTRYTTLGRGEKSDFTKTQKDLNSEFYDISTKFNSRYRRQPSYSFGIGRDHYDKVYISSNKNIDKDIPGPGKYYYLKSFGYDSPRYSMRPRYIIKEKESKSLSPGPGYYPITIKTNGIGKFSSSHVRNISTINFGADKTVRFNYNYNSNPAPNKYELKSLMGINFNSKYKSYCGKAMGKRFKIKNNAKTDTPGPGYYRAFSEFGVYESKYAKDDNNLQGNSNQSNSSKLNKKNVILDN